MEVRTSVPFLRAASRASALLALAALQAAAQYSSTPDVVTDAPARVARLSYLEGQASLAPAGSAEWAAAVLNHPLTTGDKLSLGGDARAELEAGSTTVHLDRGSAFGFVQLDDGVVQT